MFVAWQAGKDWLVTMETGQPVQFQTVIRPGSAGILAGSGFQKVSKASDKRFLITLPWISWLSICKILGRSGRTKILAQILSILDHKNVAWTTFRHSPPAHFLINVFYSSENYWFLMPIEPTNSPWNKEKNNQILYVQEVFTRPKVLNRTILSNWVHVT